MNKRIKQLAGVLSESQFFFFGCLVTLFFYAALTFVVPPQLGEAHDRAIHISLPVIFEISFLLTLVLQRFFIAVAGSERGSQGEGVSFRPGIGAFLSMLPVIGGCYFAVSSKYLALTGTGIAALIVIFEVFWRKFSRYWIVLFLEFIIAALIVVYLFKAQVLNSVKDDGHWFFFLAPLYAVLGGGVMLWDVPSQYGFADILVPAWITQLTGLEAFCALGLVVAVCNFATVLVLFCLFFSSARMSPVFSAISAAVFVLFFAGWIAKFMGPATYPSVSGFRFLPSFLVLWCVTQSLNGHRRFWTCMAVALSVVACTWSFESCLYTLAPLCAFIGLRALCDFNLSFLRTPHFLTVALGLTGSVLCAYIYSRVNGAALDPAGFYEHAMMYAN